MIDGKQLKWCDTCCRYRVNPPKTYTSEQKKEFNQICSDCRWHWQCKNDIEYKGEPPLNYIPK